MPQSAVGSKEIQTERLPSRMPVIGEEQVIEAIRRIAFETETLSVKEIAREIGRAPETAYHKLDGTITLTVAEFCRIVRLGIVHGAHEGIDLMIPDGYMLVPTPHLADDDTLEDLETELMKDEGAVIEACGSGQKKRARKAAEQGVKTAEKIVRKVRG